MKPENPPDGTHSDPAEDTDDHDSNDEDKDGETSGSDASDSSDSTEKCPICLLSFHDQEIGSPNVCEHVFCVPCIEVWSRSVKTCPIDRLTFTSINVAKNFEDRTQLRTISVDSNSNKELVLDENEEEEDLTMCEICNRADREEVLLLCDGCNRGYHTDCLTPALPEVPRGSWYCDNCFSSHSSSESDDGEINDLLNELENVGGHLLELGRMRHQPRITRTRQSERIRSTILSTTGRRPPVASTSRQIQDQPSTSRSTASRSAPKPRVVRKKRRKKYRRRTRTVVVEYDLNSDSKFPVATKKVKIVRRRRKRKVKRKAKTCKTSSSTRQSTKNAASSSSDVGTRARRAANKSFLPTFTLMGPKRDMDVLFSDSEEDEAYTRAISSGSSLMLSIRNARQGRNLLQAKSNLAVATSAAGPNLLDSIMQSMDGLKHKNDFEIVKTGRRPTSTVITVNSATIHTDESTSSAVPVKQPENESASTSTNGESSHQVEDNAGADSKSNENPVSTAATNEDSSGGKDLLHEPEDALKKSPKVEKKVEESEDNKDALLDFELPTLDSLPSVPKTTFKYADDDSDNDCPNFSVYSEETMALLAKTEGNAAAPTDMDAAAANCVTQDQQDCDEDLVQMSDNDENLQDAGEMVLSQAEAEVPLQEAPFEEPSNDQEASTPTLDERYPEETEIKSPDDQQAKTSDGALTPSPPNHHQNFEQNEIQSPDQDIIDDDSTEERCQQIEKTSRKVRQKRRDSSNEEDEDSDDAPRKKRRKEHRKKSKKEHRKRSRSRSKRRRSRERDKKPERTRSPVHQRDRRPRSRPRNHDNKSSRKQKSSRSRSRSLSHRWSPVQRRTRSKSRSFTPQRSNAPLHSKKDRSRPAPAAAVRASSSNKRSTATTKPKDVFKSGKNILVSVNFEKNNKFEYSNDPVAIIDLTNGVKETIPSAKNIIEVSDSEHEEEKMPDNSLIGAVKATIESKLKATAPPKVKPKPQPVVVVPQPQTGDPGKMSNSQTERLLSQIKTAFVDGSKRGGTSIVPDKPSKVLPATIAPRDSPEVTSGYDYLPYSPGSSDYDDLYDDANVDAAAATSDTSLQDQPGTSAKASGGGDKASKNVFNDLFGQSPVEGEQGTSKNAKSSRQNDKKATKEKYVDKLNMQKRASDEAKLCLKPYYNSKQITKDDYKDILRRAVPKICRGGEIRPQKIEALIAAYVRTIRHKSKHGGNKNAKN